MSNFIYTYACKKSGLWGLKITLSGARYMAEQVAGGVDHRRIRVYAFGVFVMGDRLYFF
jgi:hypothetical protein